MTWKDLEECVISLLSQRNLKEPRIRLNALLRLTDIIKREFRSIYDDPTLLLDVEKNKFKENVSQHKNLKRLNGAENSIIDNFYQILGASIPVKASHKKSSSSEAGYKNRNKKPEIVSDCSELSYPLFGLVPVVNDDTRVLILGTFPADESIEAGFYYQNQIKRFWGEALSYVGSFEELSNEVRRELLLAKKIGLWDIFECAMRGGSNQDRAIEKAKYNDIEYLLNSYPSIEYLVFNGKNAYLWLMEDMPSIAGRENIEVRRLQSSSGVNAWFKQGEDWAAYLETMEFL